MCFRRSKKVNDVSVVDFRQIQRKPVKSPSWFECWCFITKRSVKTGFQALRKPDHSTRANPLSAVQNRVLQRILLTAGLVVFFIALVRGYFNT